MPRVMRRTPTTEEASSYGYGDLLKDIMGKISTRATSNVERMTSGGMSEGEILETALAPAGGMLKVAGLAKLLPKVIEAKQVAGKPLGRYVKVYSTYRKELADHISGVFKEALKVPKKEYGRIRDIGWSSMKGEALGTKGLYFPMEKDIALHPTLADIETVWHEFTHARQMNPEHMSKMPGGGLEATAAQELRRLLSELTEIAGEAKISRRDFYRKVSPTERHARGVASGAVKYPKDFESIYKHGLKEETRWSGEKLRNLFRALEKQRELGMGYRLTGD